MATGLLKITSNPSGVKVIGGWSGTNYTPYSREPIVGTQQYINLYYPSGAFATTVWVTIAAERIYHVHIDFTVSPFVVTTIDEGPIITATSISTSKTTCVQPCNLTANIIWINSGISTRTFIPSIVVDTIKSSTASMSLAAGASVAKTFSITGLMAGNHTLCPDPN